MIKNSLIFIRYISFFKKLHKRVVEQILELDIHLDTEKHQKLKMGIIIIDTFQKNKNFL